MPTNNIIIVISIFIILLTLIIKILRLDVIYTTSLIGGSSMGKFFKRQGPNIITLVVILFTVLVLFKILGVNFNPTVNKHLTKVITIESMISN